MKFNSLLATVTGALVFVYLVEAANNLCDSSTGTGLLLKCDGCTGVIICMGSTVITKASCGSQFCNDIVVPGAAECVDEAPVDCDGGTTTTVSETTTTTEVITATSAATTPPTTKETSTTTAGEVTTTSTVTEVTTTAAKTSASTDATTTVSEPTTTAELITATSAATTPPTTKESSPTTAGAATTTSSPTATTSTTVEVTITSSASPTSTTVAETTSTKIQSTSTAEISTASTTTPLPLVSTILCTGVGYYPDPYNCNRYHYCPANGQISFEQICPPGYAFHDQYASTTFPCKQILRPADCIAIDCTKYKSIYTPYGTSTLYYAYCYANSMTSLPTVSMFKCSEGARFDGTVCVFKCLREGLFTNTVAPTTYYQCYFSGRSLVYRLMNCPDQQTFNAQLQVCTSGG